MRPLSISNMKEVCMTVKELIKRLVELPTNIEEAKVTFKDGQLGVSRTTPDSGEAYIIE